jgi:methanogenic corrinoid protein MtbC1
MEVRERELLLALEAAVSSRDGSVFEEAFRSVDDRTIRPEDAVRALAKGVEKVRLCFRDGQVSIPEFLLSIDVFRQGLKGLGSRAPEAVAFGKGEGVVIGVVEGDTHDMGKNIVAAVLEASGYTVFDAGRDVSRDVFLDMLAEKKAPLLALSTMMSTPLEKMREIIEWTRRLYPEVKILVGGAPLDERIARALGADGYAENAVTAPEEAARLLHQARRAQKAIPHPRSR